MTADRVGDHLLPVVLVGDVEVGVFRAAAVGADVVGYTLTGVVGDVAYHHGGALFGEQAGFDLAHAARCPGDDGDLAFQPGHGNPPAGSVNRSVKTGL